MNKVSIIVPVYNTSEFIEQSIHSLLEQSYQQIEIILINDGSTEDIEFLNDLKKQDNRVKLYHLRKNTGVAAARNLGIKKATGEFIYFFDSDDYLPPKTIEILVQYIKEHRFIHGKIKTTNFSSGLAIILDGLFQVKMYKKKKYSLIKNESVLNCLFRTDFIRNQHLSFNEDTRLYTDLSFIVPSFTLVDQVPYIKEAVYFKRKRNDAITNPSLSQSDKEMKTVDYLNMYKTLKGYLKSELDNIDDDLDYADSLNRAITFLDKRFVNFYRKTIVMFFKEGNNIPRVFDDLADAFQLVDTSILQRYNWVFKHESKHILQRKLDKYIKVSNRHHHMRQLRQGLKSRKKFYIYLYRNFFINKK